jgi:hypothetical protein
MAKGERLLSFSRKSCVYEKFVSLPEKLIH